jgi:hypothetical protein
MTRILYEFGTVMGAVHFQHSYASFLQVMSSSKRGRDPFSAFVWMVECSGDRDDAVFVTAAVARVLELHALDGNFVLGGTGLVDVSPSLTYSSGKIQIVIWTFELWHLLSE